MKNVYNPPNFAIYSYKGYWRKNGNTAHPMIPNNWVSIKDSEAFTFGDAQNFVWAHLKGEGTEIVSRKL